MNKVLFVGFWYQFIRYCTAHGIHHKDHSKAMYVQNAEQLVGLGSLEDWELVWGSDWFEAYTHTEAQRISERIAILSHEI